MLSFFDYMKLRRFESDMKKAKIEYLQMYDAPSDSVVVRLRDIKTGRIVSSQITYHFYDVDYDAVVKVVLDLYSMLKEGASL